MTLDEYRRKVIERLKDCRSVEAAREILREVDLFVTASGINEETRDQFWELLDSQLDILSEASRFLGDRQQAMQAGTVVAAARARIARYRLRPADSSDAL
jgi:hypothetical protein